MIRLPGKHTQSNQAATMGSVRCFKAQVVQQCTAAALCFHPQCAWHSLMLWPFCLLFVYALISSTACVWTVLLVTFKQLLPNALSLINSRIVLIIAVNIEVKDVKILQCYQQDVLKAALWPLTCLCRLFSPLFSTRRMTWKVDGLH